MRDIDSVRIVLSRLKPTFPPDIIDAIMKPIFMPLKRASITIQRYARGLLARFRDTRLSYANFNRDTKRAIVGLPTDDQAYYYYRDWDHYDLVDRDNRGYNAIRNTRANRNSTRRLQSLGQLDERHTEYLALTRWWRGWEVGGKRQRRYQEIGPRQTVERDNRMYDRNQKRFEWLLSNEHSMVGL